MRPTYERDEVAVDAGLAGRPALASDDALRAAL
jgi:hypothetical protein